LAQDWEKQALPIGNGHLGAMIFGGVAGERIQYHEEGLFGFPTKADQEYLIVAEGR
jgi:alpha-L-fucosidase 2